MGNTADAVDLLPLKDVVLCCTSLSKDVRTKISSVALELGATHKLDLTIDTTHLLIGDIHTPKYRYVAKSRPDIRALRPEFIDAVRTQWMQGEDVDVSALEKEYTFPIFHNLQICITGFEVPEDRKKIEADVELEGAKYHCDLTKEVTHLIVAKPQGAKYVHAKQWGISVVSYKWYVDSLARGMMLEESYYHPETPVDQQGVGAFKALAVNAVASRRKRPADDESGEDLGKRKLRKVASQRLESQSQDMWQNISTRDQNQERNDAWDTETDVGKPLPAAGPGHRDDTAKRVEGILAGYFVMTRGFDKAKAKRLADHLEPNGAVVVSDEEELETIPKDGNFKAQLLLVPHDRDVLKDNVPMATTITTEWWLERCIHQKQSIDPTEDAMSHPLGGIRIPLFHRQSISTTGFGGVELRQTAEAIKILGATYQEQLLPTTSVLISASSNVRREKAAYALKHRIPIVSAAWLWTCIKSKDWTSFDSFIISTGSDLGMKTFSTTLDTRTNLMSTASGHRMGEESTGAGHPHPKRLSSSRRLFPTPALMLQTSQVTQKAIGGFVLDESETDEPIRRLDKPKLAMSTEAVPLREISPNVSQRTLEDDRSQKDAILVADQESLVEIDAGQLPPHTEGEAVEEAATHEQLANQLASLISRQAQYAKLPIDPSEVLQRRKHRPLGRNLSGVSHRSNSVTSTRSERPSPHLHVEDSYEIADGFATSREAVPALGTQLGYDTPEAEAHRAQVSRQMGVKIAYEDGVYGGTREERVGTVTDRGTRGVVGKARTRERRSARDLRA